MRPLSTVIALALLSFAGCSLGGGGDDKEQSAKGETSTARKAPATPAEPAAFGPEFAAGVSSKDRFQLRGVSVRREGPFMTLNGTVECVKPEDGEECSFLSTFRADTENNNFSGFRLLDTAGGRSYAVVRDGQEQSYTSKTEPSLDRGRSTRFWVRFAAPPADVRNLDLLVPGGGPSIPGVPVREGGGVDTSKPPAGTAAASPDEFDRPPESTDASGLDLQDSDVTARVRSRAADTVEKRGEREITLAADVLFDFNKASLDSTGRSEIDRAAADAADRADGTVKVDGYTDSKGSNAYNLSLSRRRAATVSKALGSRLDGQDIESKGRGEANPVAPNTKSGQDNPAGRKRNRRVTISYAVKPKPVATETPDSEPDAESSNAEEWDFKGPLDETTTFRASVDSLRRTGNLALLTIDITCVRSPTDDCERLSALVSRRSDTGQGNGTLNRLSGVTLFDSAGKATYEPAFDTTREQITSLVNLVPGATQRMYAYYLAPPASVDAITVQIPNGGPRITGVPVS